MEVFFPGFLNLRVDFHPIHRVVFLSPTEYRNVFHLCFKKTAVLRGPAGQIGPPHGLLAENYQRTILRHGTRRGDRSISGRLPGAYETCGHRQRPLPCGRLLKNSQTLWEVGRATVLSRTCPAVYLGFAYVK